MKTVTAADLFCGAGGTSMGMGRACRDLGLGLDLLAVNHWPVAIETHSRNHPAARHLCETLDSVDPRKVIPGGRLNLLVASPECMHHSRARGGKPIHDQSRSSAHHVPRWLDALKVDGFIVENVPEFADWGPLDRHNRPIKSRKGETFSAWVNLIRSQDYTVDVQVLNAADYGDATTRQRLFVLGRKGRRSIAWPEPTHSERGTADLFGSRLRWRAAREIIDWSIQGQSIYGRKKPLAPNTLARIAEGIRRYGGGSFTLAQGGGGVARDIDHPVPTITTDGAIRVVEPFIYQYAHGGRVHPVDQPLPTLTASTGRSGGDFAVVEAFIACYYGTTNLHPVSKPLPTVTTKDRFALVEPLVVDGHMLDIRVRMLRPHELAGAMSFGAGYSFAGTQTEQKKQIGNAVPGELARALCRAQLEAFAA